VDENSGAIVLQAEGSFWPRYDGVDYYSNSDERDILNPDVIYAGALVPAPATAQPSIQGLEELRRLAPDPTAGKWALVVSGSGTAANADEKADVDSAKAIFGVLGVPNDNITTLDRPTEAALCTAIGAMPKKCPKLYVYVTAHGKPGWFATHGDTVKATEFAGKLKDLMAGEYCIIMAQCFSGSFFDAFRDSSLNGMHMSAAKPDTQTWARRGGNAKYPWAGEIFTHYWAHCVRAGLRGKAAYQCARDSVSAYVARRNKQGAALHDPMPQTSTAFKDTMPGQATTFEVPSGSGSVCINWKPGPAEQCANATVYCEVVSGPDTSWKVVKTWNWNLGETRYFSPNGTGATGKYKLVSHANGYPDCGDIRFPMDVIPETPSSNPTFPAGSAGWVDHVQTELRALSLFGTNTYQPGLDLFDVSRYVGTVGTDFSNFDMVFPLNVDPSRPWLYNDGDPLLGLNAQTTLEIHATGLFEPGGNPVTGLPVDVFFEQPPESRYFPIFAFQTPGGIDIPPVDLGPILPEPFRVRVEVLSLAPEGPGVGYMELDAVVLNTITFGTVNVTPQPVPSVLALSAPRPNPFVNSTEVTLSLPRASSVRARVFDLAGREIAELARGAFAAGTHPLRWNGRDGSGASAPAGVYFLQVKTDEGASTRRIVRMR
jgi:hypothetical protein